MSTELPEPDALNPKAAKAAEKAAARAARAAQKDALAAAKADEKQERKLEKQGQKSQRKALAKEERAEKYAKIPLSKRIAITSGRMLVGLIGIGATVVVLGSVALVPWPSWGVSAPVVDVNPTGTEQQRVCAGPLLTVGANLSAATTISSIGAATVVATGGTTSSLTTDNPNAASDGAPQVLASPSDAAPLAASQSQELNLETVAGLTASACAEPVTESWLVGGTTALGHTAVLVLGNASDVPAEVHLELFGADGQLSTIGLGTTTVEPGQQVSLPLNGYAPSEPNLVVHVMSQGGRVAAALDTTAINGLTPFGADVIGPSAALATTATIPGLVVDASAAQAEFGAGADGFASVRLLAPTEQTLTKITVIGENGIPGATFSADLQPGEVTDLPLLNLAPGTYSLMISAEHAVVAAAQSALLAALPTTPPTNAVDYAWFASASTLPDAAGLAVPSAAPATLHLANPTAADVTVTIGGGQPVVVGSGKAVTVAVPAGASQLTGMQGLVASLSLQNPGRLASFTVPGVVLDSSSVAVYTR